MKSCYRTAAFALACLAITAPRPARAEAITIAVLDLQDKGAGAELTGNLTDVLTVSLARLGVFRVLSRADIQKMLEFETDKQAMGCEEASCLAEIGGALGVALLVNGSVGKVGGNYVINLSLTDTDSAKVRAREQRQVSGEEALPEAVAGAARFLVRELLQGQQGALILSAQESGAEVEIDGRLVGVTPLGQQLLAGGPHTLKVHKKGFVSWARDIEIKADQPAVIDATLVPSVEFIADYDSRAASWRLATYLSGGGAVALVGFGLGGYLWNAGRAADYEYDLDITACRAGDRPYDFEACADFKSRKNQIQSFHTLTMLSLGIGTALAVTSAVLWNQGPEVGLYDRYKTATTVPQLDVVPTAKGGAMGLLSWRL